MMKSLLSASILTIALTGCARFSTIQTDVSYEEGQPSRTITTKAQASTLFTARSALANFKASQTDKTQGASVGSLNQESSSSNAVALAEKIVSAVVKAAVTP